MIREVGWWKVYYDGKKSKSGSGGSSALLCRAGSDEETSDTCCLPSRPLHFLLLSVERFGGLQQQLAMLLKLWCCSFLLQEAVKRKREIEEGGGVGY